MRIVNQFQKWRIGIGCFTLLTLTSSCAKLAERAGKNPNGGLEVPVALYLSGAPTINAGDCYTVTATSLNLETKPTAVSLDTTLSLSSNSGDLYSDSNCSSSATSIRLKEKQSSIKFYFKSHSPGNSQLTADGRPTLIAPGFLTVTVLPDADVQLSDGPSYNFGPRFQGTSTDKTMTVTNLGESGITTLGPSGLGLSTPFSFKGGSYPGTGGTCGSSLGYNGASCSIVISFNPTTLNTFNDSVLLSYSDSTQIAQVSRALSGSGVNSGSVSQQTITPFETGDDRAFGIKIQSDGKMLVAGVANRTSTGNDFALTRYLSGGSLDTGFGTSGKSYASISTDNGDDRALALALQGDGKILLAGYAFTGGVYQFALVRFNSDGSLDTTFGSSGIAKTSIGIGNAFAFAITVQSDAKIVLAGYSQQGAGNQISLARFLSDGSLDSSFGTSGLLVSTIGSGSSYANAVEVQSDGKIVVAGYASNLSTDFAILRYTGNGTLDSNFGSNGVALIDFANNTDYAYALKIQTDGKLVLAGTTFSGGNNHFALLRVNSNGTLDTSFNSTGQLTAQLATNYDEAHALSIQSDGKIVASGYAYNGNDYDFALLRLDSTGAVDVSFGGSGKVTVGFGSGRNDRAYAIDITTSGEIWTAGDTRAASDFDFGLASFLP